MKYASASKIFTREEGDTRISFHAGSNFHAISSTSLALLSLRNNRDHLESNIVPCSKPFDLTFYDPTRYFEIINETLQNSFFIIEWGENSRIRTWCSKIIIFVFKNIILGKEGILRGTLLALTTWWSNLMSAWAKDWPQVFRARFIGSSSDHDKFLGNCPPTPP